MLATIAQRELIAPVGPFAGLGLFSGKPGSLRVLPAPAGSGLILRSVRVEGIESSPATIAHLTTDTSWSSVPARLPPGITPHRLVRNTTLTVGPRVLATIEHIMGALAGLAIADAIIEVQGIEVPILDGSAHAFAHALHEASREHHPPASVGRRESIKLTREVHVEEAGASIVATPLPANQTPSVTYHLNYDGPLAMAFPPQSATWHADAHGPASFLRDIAPARTFSFESEARAAHSLGMFHGFSSSDLLILRHDGTPVEGSLRFSDEPARHKLLDLLGDLALLGHPMHAKVIATRSGHALTHNLCRAILQAMM